MLCSTACRASANCSVISANDRVNPPSSSLPCNIALGLRLPAATSRTPSASTSSGRTKCLPSSTASSTAPKTARNRLSVSVPTYMRRRPARTKARSWYSRLASCTAMALATSADGKLSVACRERGSSNRSTRGLLTSASTLTRAFCTAAWSAISSSPSICAVARCWRTLRSSATPGRSGFRLKRDWPALATAWPAAFHSTMSVAPILSRRRAPARRQCALDLHVEPAFDGACDELVGHHIDQQTGHQPDQRKNGGQLGQQPAAKTPFAQAHAQTQGHPDQHRQQHQRHQHVHAKEPGVVAFVQRAVVRRQGEQEQQHHADGRHEGRTDPQRPAQRARLAHPVPGGGPILGPGGVGAHRTGSADCCCAGTGARRWL